MTKELRRAFGPFQVVEKLGGGGTGLVLRAVSADTGVIALKIPRGEDLSRREALRREIGILRRLNRARIRGVVTILDHGVEHEVPWYAMELLQGHSLRFWSDRLWDHTRAARERDRARGETTRTVAIERRDGEPSAEGAALPWTDGASLELPSPARGVTPFARAGAEQLERVLGVLLRLAEILSQLHDEGVIHGDLTPQNVVFRDETDPVLIDFGVALADLEPETRRELPFDPAGRGTPGYVAPEIIAGEPMDARSDLYSLGCIGYELLTGRRAFAADRQCDVLRQQLHATLVAPSRLAPDLPEELDRLVQSLLERDPTRRLSRAEDVCHALRQSLRSPGSLRGTRGSTALFRSRLFGREATLTDLVGTLRSLPDQAGGLVLVRGPSGIGKTRLLNELAREAQRRGVQVIWCSSRRFSASDDDRGEVSGGGLELFHPVLDELMASEHGETEDELARAYADLEALVPDRATSSAPSSAGTGGALSSDEARKLGLAGLFRILCAAAPPAGLLILVDDLQWADELSLLFLRWYAAALEKSRVLVVANYRSEATFVALDELERHARARVELEHLDAPAGRAMIKDLLATPTLPDGLFEFLEGHAGGNPFFVAEYTRAAIAQGLLRRRAGGEWVFDARKSPDLGLPASIEGLLELRVRALSEPARAALKFACVFGKEFDAEVFRLLLPVELDPAEVLEELVAREVLAATGLGRYRFTHDKLREAQGKLLSNEERRQAHARVSAYLEQGGSPWLVDRSAALGYHFASADEPERALEHLRAAARRAGEHHALEHATELYRLAIRQAEIATRPEARMSLPFLREALAEVLILQARHAEARACWEQLSTQLAPEDRLGRARVQHKIAASFWTLHDYAAAARALDAAQEALGPAPDAATAPSADAYFRELIQIQLGRFEQLYFSGQSGPRLDELTRELAPLIERYGSADQRCFYHFTAASYVMLSKRYRFDERALALAEQGLEAARSLTPARQAMAHFILAFALTLGTREQCQASLAEFERSIVQAELTREATMISRIRTYHAISCLRLGDVDATERAAAQALSSAEIAQLPPYVAAAHACQGWVAWKRDATERARSLLSSARAIWNQHPHQFPFQSLALFPLLEMACSRDDFHEADHLLEELEISLPELPPALAEAVGAARRALGRADARESARALTAVVSLARQHALA